jgi:hypothetical protein
VIHPFERWPATHRREWVVVLVVAFLACVAVFTFHDRPLETEAAPNGIVDLELAGSAEKAERIRQSWADNDALDEAGFSIGFDYVFLLVYSTGLAALCALGAAAMRRRGVGLLATIGVLAAWGAWGAALCDAVENAAMLPLLDRPTDSWASTAAAFATAKFVLLVIGLLFALTAGVAALVRKPA